VKKALNSLEFLVVQEIFMSETAKFANVVLPGASFFEKSGTFTNGERRVQRVNESSRRSPARRRRPDRRGHHEPHGHPAARLHAARKSTSHCTVAFGGFSGFTHRNMKSALKTSTASESLISSEAW